MTIQKACSTCGSPCHRQCKILSGVHVIVSPDLAPRAIPCFNYMQTDILVLSMLSGLAAHDFSWAVDSELNELLKDQVTQRGFSGEMGTYLLVDLKALGRQRDDIRYVLICGVGFSHKFNKKAVCVVFGLGVDMARKLGVKKVTIPIPPFRLTADRLNLKGTAAILRCRLAREAEQHEGMNLLKEVEVFLTPQAKHYFEEGLEVGGELCPGCKLSRLDTVRRRL